MSDQNQAFLAPHETLELHEIVKSSIVEMKKLQASQSMVKDPDLASFMQDSLNAKTQRMREIQQFITSNDGVQ